MTWCSKHFGGPTPKSLLFSFLDMLTTPTANTWNSEEAEVSMVCFSMEQVRSAGELVSQETVLS